HRSERPLRYEKWWHSELGGSPANSRQSQKQVRGTAVWLFHFWFPQPGLELTAGFRYLRRPLLVRPGLSALTAFDNSKSTNMFPSELPEIASACASSSS